MEPSAQGTLQEMTNGPGSAAALAAGAGIFVLAILSIIADKIPRFGREMIFYRPTGALSGVTTSAIVIWLIVWAFLHFRWRNRTVASGRICAVAIVLLCLGVILTFPPIADLF